MNRHASLTKKHTAGLFALLGLGVFAPVLLSTATSLSWLPDWLGPAIAVAALFGALVVFWREGVLRIGFLVLFAVALVLAAVLGQILSRT